MRKLLKKQGFAPKLLVTDKLRPYPNFADSTRRCAIFAGQVIERQRVPRPRTPKIGCSADQVYSQGRQCADNWRP
jgi:hypothetical protein